MNGFLVRADGALISIDHILWITKEPLKVNAEWVVKVYLRDGVSIDWTLDPVSAKDADDRLHTLRDMLQEAIKF